METQLVKTNSAITITPEQITISGKFDGYEMAQMVDSLRTLQKHQRNQNAGVYVLGKTCLFFGKIAPIMFPLLIVLMAASVIMNSFAPRKVIYQPHSVVEALTHG